MVKVTVEKDGEKNVFTGESVIGMTMTKKDLDDNKVVYAGNRFGMIDMDGEYLPELLVELINNLFKEVHETPVEYLHAMVRTSELLHETTKSAITENADSLADTLRAALKGETV